MSRAETHRHVDMEGKSSLFLECKLGLSFVVGVDEAGETVDVASESWTIV